MKSFFYTQQYYTMDGKPERWKIAYYPLYGTYVNSGELDLFGEPIKVYKEFDEPRALIERQIKGGTDFREIPLRYLNEI